MEVFLEREGHAKVPLDYKTADGYWVGNWVGRQRTEKDKLSPERKARLGSLPGWSWNTNEDQWEDGFHYLKEFTEREGHAKVPNKYKTPDGYQLGQWVRGQRSREDSMSPERKVRLEVLPGWGWVAGEQWEEGFHHLKEFADREGHARVSNDYVTPDGYRLGSWASRQRTFMDEMLPEHRIRLEALPGWSWNINDAEWEDGFCHLKEFVEREGHCLPRQRYKSENGYRLGVWVDTQRANRNKMPSERRARLEALSGWVWSTNDAKWEEGFRHLKEFVDREGHANMPSHYTAADGYRLGQWVAAQRAHKDDVSSDRKARLEALPRWFWNANDYRWEEGFCYLKEFVDREGHARVPNGYVTADGYPLGTWVTRQRSCLDDISPERKARLETFPCWNWDHDTSVIAQWIEECCVIGATERIPASGAYQSYRKHAEEHGEMPVSQKGFPQRMEAWGFGRLKSCGVRYFTGIRLRTPADPAPGDYSRMDFRLVLKSTDGAHLTDEDMMSQWMEECCIIGSKVREQTSELYKTYRKYTEEHGDMPVSQKRFPQLMEAWGFGRVKSCGVRYFTGIRLRTPVDPAPDDG